MSRKSVKRGAAAAAAFALALTGAGVSSAYAASEFAAAPQPPSDVKPRPAADGSMKPPAKPGQDGSVGGFGDKAPGDIASNPELAEALADAREDFQLAVMEANQAHRAEKSRLRQEARAAVADERAALTSARKAYRTALETETGVEEARQEFRAARTAYREAQREARAEQSAAMEAAKEDHRAAMEAAVTEYQQAIREAHALYGSGQSSDDAVKPNPIDPTDKPSIPRPPKMPEWGKDPISGGMKEPGVQPPGINPPPPFPKRPEMGSGMMPGQPR